MKILIIDDHPLFREGVGLLLQHLDAGVETIYANSIGDAQTAGLERRELDLILLDLELPNVARGVTGLTCIRATYPDVPVVMLSASDDAQLILECLDCGAMGFLTKSSSTEVFHAALKLVVLGNVYIPPQALAAMKSPRNSPAPTREALAHLSPRETAVFSALIEGQPNKIIARNLNIAEQTVKFHVSNILKALKVTNRTQAVLAAARMGLKVSWRRAELDTAANGHGE